MSEDQPAPLHAQHRDAILSNEAEIAEAFGSRCLEMVPSSWRLALTGYGRMTKEEAMNIAEEYGVPRQDDLADALCMALVARKRWMSAAQ